MNELVNDIFYKMEQISSTKEKLRLAFGLDKSVPFNQYASYINSVWTPSILFNNGSVGVWYDPSDISTLFKDVIGTQPVIRNGDPVGLILDKSRRLQLKPNTVETTPQKGTLETYAIDVLETEGTKITYAHNIEGIGGLAYLLTTPYKTNDFVQITVDMPTLTGNVYLRLVAQGNGAGSSGSSVETTLKLKVGLNKAILSVSGITATHLQIQASGEATFSVSGIRAERIPGNHATQGVSSFRPLYKTDGFLHWLQFDGIDDFLTSTFEMQQPYTRSTAFISLSAVDFIYDGAKSNESSLLSTTEGYRLMTQPTLFIAQPYELGKHISAALFNGTNSYLRIDKTQHNGIIGTAPATGLTLGRAGAVNSNHLIGSIYCFISCKGYLNPINLSNIESYMTRKSGLVL